MLILIKTAERLYRILYILHHLTFRTKSWCPRELFFSSIPGVYDISSQIQIISISLSLLQYNYI